MRNSKEIIRLIKNMRESKKMSIEELATRVGIAKSTLSRYENEQRDFPINDIGLYANALDTSIENLLGLGASNAQNNVPIVADGKMPYYSLNEKDERDIAKMLEEMMNGLSSGNQAFSFMGEPMDDEDRELLRISLENTLRMSKQMAKKKFTPKKYRNEE